jgi:hypothetical protein
MPGVGDEVSVTDGDGELPPDELLGPALGLVFRLCPVEADAFGTAVPDDLRGLHVALAFGVAPEEPSVDGLCELAALLTEPPLAPGAPPLCAEFELLGDTACWASMAT